MSTIWRIFTRDLLRILRNPVAVVVTLGVALIPSLYAWFNILANWDPYSSTGNLQVAVSNEDRGTSSDLVGRLDAGAQVVTELKKNDALGWQFVDSDTAVQGVQSGEYYAAIVLPKDFSESLVNSVTGSAKRPSIKYYVNEKKNAIAPKITDTGATTIDSQINSTFVATVGKTLASAVSQAGGKLDTELDGTQSNVVKNLNDTVSKIEKTRSSLKELQGTLDQANSTIKDSRATVATLNKQVAAAQKATDESKTLLVHAQGSAQSFSSTLAGALDDGSAQLSAIGVNVNNAAGTATDSFNTAQESVDTVTSSLQQQINAATTLSSDLKTAMNEAGIDSSTPEGKRIWDEINRLDTTISDQQTKLNTFHDESTKFIDSGKDATSNLAGASSTIVSGGIATLTNTRSTLTGSITPNLTDGLASFAALTGTASGTLTTLSATLNQSDSLFDQLATTLADAKTTVGQTASSLSDLQNDIESVRDDIAALDSSAVYQKIAQTLNIDASSVADFMGSPVKLTTKTVYPVDNYGSSVTPFYTNLALWVGGFVLIAIYKLEVDREHIHDMTATQAYLGRWLLFVAVGFLQALIAGVGDLVLGIQCEHPLLFLLACLFCSFVYVNIIYALAIAFRHIGKAVAVILVIIQIPGASGLYPIELMPDFFRELHPWLPFTYGINAMRGPIAGMYGGQYWSDMGHLALYLPAALFVGLIVRRYALNLNALFDRRLAETDLMITEKNAMVNERISFSALLSQFEGTSELRKVVKHRAHRFFGRYPRLIRSGLILLAVLPFIFLVLLFVIPNKSAMLSAWIASIIIIDAYLIIVEYMRDNYARQLGLSAMSADDFRDAVLHGYQHRRLTFGPHDARHAAPVTGVEGMAGTGAESTDDSRSISPRSSQRKEDAR
ncbi:ABC transporter [Bifidobacterium goeldii]|uniref:ABC transporter n=1 Tax=Bifidobacterium goeldii TaxID=2306975 RepID=A0A430FHF2_9BIFI|nr:YhgE/Pip domain-containing protein [Bifidobacterium goeldii]RSX52221.1 ABC transporter [Bifidobacterium goeldii]